jgi:signal transduction histidine kinase
MSFLATTTPLPSARQPDAGPEAMSSAMSSAPNVIEFPGRRLRVDQCRELDARRAASEERMRIARELHDVVGFSFATISVQAGVAVHLLEEQPERAAEALKAIKTASREALGELRTILGMLRQIDDVESQSTAPGLGRLDALADSTTAAGVPTQVRVEGKPRPLPAAVDLAAFRIVQESLANVLRHAGPASAVVTISYERAQLTIQVEDDGRGAASGDRSRSEGSGHGLVGMGERTRELGGEFEAGSRPEAGFRVRAHLPVLGRP